jgi:hypothetical protein
MSKHRLTRLTTARTWGKPPPSPYSILCAYPWDKHSNVILSRDSQVEVMKFPYLGFMWLWGPIILRADLRLRWGPKKIYSPYQELSNSMSHATCTQGNQGDTWLLVIESQIANLTPCPFFGHNLCFKYPNESCKPILDIFVPRDFQWCRKLLHPMGFDP